MRRNLLGPLPPHPSPSFRGPGMPPATLRPHPHHPGRLGPDPTVAQGRGCRRRQRLGNILWTAGCGLLAGQTGGSAPPRAGQKSAGGRVNMAQGGQTWGGGKECTHTQSHTQHPCHPGHRETANRGHTDRVRHKSGQDGCQTQTQ